MFTVRVVTVSFTTAPVVVERAQWWVRREIQNVTSSLTKSSSCPSWHERSLSRRSS